jgi:hypothetical protein
MKGKGDILRSGAFPTNRIQGEFRWSRNAAKSDSRHLPLPTSF